MQGFISVFALTVAVSAEALACEGCLAVDSSLKEDAHTLAIVTVPRAYFLNEEGEAEKVYVVRGDELIAMRFENGKLLASYFNNRGHETNGWLKLDEVKLVQPGPHAAASWIGAWTAGEWSNITIAKADTPGWLVATGEGYWAASAEAYASGGVNEGSFGGTAPIQDGKLGFTVTDDDSYKPFDPAESNLDCAVELELIGSRYLYAQDNGNCGGHNVRFLGHYARAKGN
jgi:hypothetical protein